MASHKDVSNTHDVSSAEKSGNPARRHPSEGVDVRIAKESGFAAPGLDVPAAQSRPARSVQSPKTHPLNSPIGTENKSFTGPQLGRGGTEGPRLAPVAPTETFGGPAFPSKSYSREADVAHANTNFQDVSSLIMRPRGAASAASDGDGDE
jgi:hypothetical protein